MQTQALIEHLNAYLNAASFKDYAPNGLQVEGKPEIHRIVLGVSASQALIDHACSMGADCILVHHGWFWKGERSEVVGMKQRRLKALLKNDINLIAYHLPLDAHEEVGNNAEIARVLGLEIEQRAGSLELLFVGRPKDGSVPVEAFVEMGNFCMSLPHQLFACQPPAFEVVVIDNQNVGRRAPANLIIENQFISPGGKPGQGILIQMISH